MMLLCFCSSSPPPPPWHGLSANHQVELKEIFRYGPGMGVEADGGVMRCQRELTDDAARDHSIEAGMDRLVARWKHQRRMRKRKQAPDQALDLNVGADVELEVAVDAELELDTAVDADGEPDVPPLWVVHAPPHDTVGDFTQSGARVGSLAVRRAIERWRPRLTLHGHIHESVGLHGGQFTQLIGGQEWANYWGEGVVGRGIGGGGGDIGGHNGGGGGNGNHANGVPLNGVAGNVCPPAPRTSVVMSVGNDFRSDHPHCIIVDTDRPAHAVRIHCVD